MDTWQQRSRFRHWIEDNIEGEVLIWNGLLSPDPGIQGGWATTNWNRGATSG